MENIIDKEASAKEDVSLMLAAKAGDLDAFSFLVKKHQNSLMNFFRRSGVYIDVEDIAQETFLKLYRARSSYEAKAKFTTFLYLIARQVMIDHFRKQERKAQLLQKYGEEVPQFEAPKEDDGESDEIMAALATLTPALRETIVLVIMQGMSYQDAAEILGVPLGTVKSRVSVGLGRLKAYFLKLGK